MFLCRSFFSLFTYGNNSFSGLKTPPLNAPPTSTFCNNEQTNALRAGECMFGYGLPPILASLVTTTEREEESLFAFLIAN